MPSVSSAIASAAGRRSTCGDRASSSSTPTAPRCSAAAPAERFRDARHGDAVAQELVDRLLRGALERRRRRRKSSRCSDRRARPWSCTLSRCRDADGTLIGAAAFVDDVTGAAAGRERAARLRGQREPRAQDADRRDGAAGRDVSRVRRPGGGHAGSREQLVREAERLARIVDDLLDLSLRSRRRKQPIREPGAGAGAGRRGGRPRAGPRRSPRNIPLHVGDDPRRRWSSRATRRRWSARSRTCSTTR